MIIEIVADDCVISYTLDLNYFLRESRHLLPVDRADRELQTHAQAWSKICCARVYALFHTVADQ